MSTEYPSYLDGKNISYVVTGKEHIDLARAAEILKETFGIERLGVVGGPAINTAFLDADLLDEVIVLIGAALTGERLFPLFSTEAAMGKRSRRRLNWWM